MTRARTLLVLVALAGCGRSVDLTVTVEKATFRAEPDPAARAVGVAKPGTLLEAREPGPFGQKGFYRLRRGDQTVYLSDTEAAPAPLAGSPMVLQVDAEAFFADRALTKQSGELAFGDAVSVFDRLSDDHVAAVVRGGVVAGYARRDGLVAKGEAAARLESVVFDAVRSGDVERAQGLAVRLKGNELATGSRLLGLAAALQKATDAPASLAPPLGPLSYLRTSDPPRAGARAQVIPVALPAFADARLAGPPSTELQIDQPVDVLELDAAWARVVPRPLTSEAADAGAPVPGGTDGGVAPPTLQPPPAPAVYVDPRGLQLEPQHSADLLDRARAFGKDGKREEQIELLTRAAAVPDATGGNAYELFDAAVAAGNFERAVWAGAGWRWVDLVLWQGPMDAKSAAAEGKVAAEVARAFAPAVELEAEVLPGEAVVGLAPGSSLIALGACDWGEHVSDDVLGLFGPLNTHLAIRRVQAAVGSKDHRRLACPALANATGDQCAGKVFWQLTSQAEVPIGKSMLRGLQLSYDDGHCGDGAFTAAAGALTVFVLTGPAGRPLQVVSDGSRSSLCTIESEYQREPQRATLAAEGRGLDATFVRWDEDCGDRHTWRAWRDGLRATVVKGAIVLKKLPAKRLAQGDCPPPEDEDGD